MIKKANLSDASTLAHVAVRLWDSHEIESLQEEFEGFLSSEDAACFLKYVDDEPVGFAYCQLRTDYVEGTDSSPVGYLEGIYIDERFRHLGFAGELLIACETWARDKQCIEFASDCERGNTDSYGWHMASGFAEAGRSIHFRRDLR